MLRRRRRRDGGQVLDLEVLLSGCRPLGTAALDDRPCDQRDDPRRIQDETLHVRRWLLEVWGVRGVEDSPVDGKRVGFGRCDK